MEPQRLLVDTSVFIDYFRKRNKSKSVFYELSLYHPIATSVVSYFEILAGAKEHDGPFLDEMFTHIQILEFTEKGAHIAAELYQTLRKTNKLIEFRDLFIAATALDHDCVLATLNQKHFVRIPNLRLYSV